MHFNLIERDKMTNLQSLFEQTAQDHTKIDEFVETLLKSTVFCLGVKNASGIFEFRLVESADGDSAVPFFLNFQTIYDDIGLDVAYLELNARILFEKTKGSSLVLNPTQALFKEFSPEEITTILSSYPVES